MPQSRSPLSQRRDPSKSPGRPGLVKSSSLQPPPSSVIASRSSKYLSTPELRREVDADSDDGYDSDATVDLNEGLLSPVLQGAQPLQRMTSDYEQLVLRSISRGKSIAYVCACSLRNGNKEQRDAHRRTAKWVVTDELRTDDSGDEADSSTDEDEEEGRIDRSASSKDEHKHLGRSFRGE